MNVTDRILVTGGSGMLGSALVRLLHTRGYQRVLAPRRSDLDLCDERNVREWFLNHRPDYVFLSAAKVGGIAANAREPVEFLSDNLKIQVHALDCAWALNCKKMLVVGSSCMYPRETSQPMREESLLTGPLEPTNEGYALAKLAGLRLGQAYASQYGLRVVCPVLCNLYGTGDHFDPERGHVLAALVRRFVDAGDDRAESVEVWGTGRARREFMHVDDAAEALLLLVKDYENPDAINVGTGRDVSIRELASMVADAAGYNGNVTWNHAKPDGMPAKCLDVSKLTALGFRPRVTLEEGIHRTVAEYRKLKACGATSNG